MSYLRDTVIVLKKEPFREQDRRYYLYGREHGLLIAVARGSSSPKSKQAGHLEPFSYAEVMIAKGTAFDKLAVAKGAGSYLVPRTSYLASYAIRGSISDLVLKLMRPGVADERIYDLLAETLDVTASFPVEPSPDRARLILSAATLKLLDALGFAPIINPSGEATTPVQSLALASFLRRAPLSEVLRITGSVDIFRATSGFVEEALKATHLTDAPTGPRVIAALSA
ncbi:MAG: recombination protein O N-terminal domain-containing protein [Patescibacteria group bacterium]|nr:recombination protein O N-terminal domain-containing protein [Patescibacteria group bacterium]